MSRFTVRHLLDLSYKINVYELLEDGKSLFEKFQGDVKKSADSYAVSLNRFPAMIEQYSKKIILPATKFRKLKGSKTKWNEFEFKAKPLRLYMTTIDGFGAIIMFGGYKTSQKSDIKKLQNLTVKVFEEYEAGKLKIIKYKSENEKK